MRPLHEQLPDALLITEGGTVRVANGLAHRLLAAEADALAGTPLSRWMAPGELDRVRTILAQRAGAFTDLPETFRLRFLRADGQAVIVDAHFALDGEALVFVLRDATEDARAEALMSRLATLSRGGQGLSGADALLDAAAPVFLELGWRGAFTRIERDGSFVLRSVACPPGDPIGAYVETLVGKLLPRDRTPVLHQVVTEQRAIFLDNIPAFMAGPPQQAKQLSESLVRSHAYRSAWLPVREPGGAITHLLSMAGRDMSERDFVALQLFAAQLGEANELARLKAELVQRERLAAVGEMAAVLAHEIRNPLGVVFNAANTLKRTVTGEVNESLLGSLLEEAERLRTLTGDLLDFARPAAPHLAPVDLSKLAADVVSAAAVESRRGTRVALEVPGTLPRAEADEALLRRVLLNLCLNALQHVTPGGQVRLSAAEEGGALKVRVENDGEPVPPGLEQRIFEPFFTTRAAGAGLGLAVVKRLVTELGGQVALEPRVDGACFVVTLPVADTTGG
ncbi:MAG: ATP-binding protein [Myxococcota bacterium]